MSMNTYKRSYNLLCNNSHLQLFQILLIENMALMQVLIVLCKQLHTYYYHQNCIHIELVDLKYCCFYYFLEENCLL